MPFENAVKVLEFEFQKINNKNYFFQTLHIPFSVFFVNIREQACLYM